MIWGWKAVIKHEGQYYSQRNFRTDLRTQWKVGESKYYPYPVKVANAGFHFSLTPAHAFRFMIDWDNYEYSLLRVIGNHPTESFNFDYSGLLCATNKLIPVAAIDLTPQKIRDFTVAYENYWMIPVWNSHIWSLYETQYPELYAKDMQHNPQLGEEHAF